MAKRSPFTAFCIALWKERKYLDAWSVNHFLAGFLLAPLFGMLEVSLLWASVLAFVLFVLWEFFEYFTDQGEARTNQVTDVFVDSTGFALGWFLWQQQLLSIPALTVLGVFFVAMVSWAYVIKVRYRLDYC